MLPDVDSLAVDVDGTLLLWPGDKPGHVPRPGEPGFGLSPVVNVGLVRAIKEWKQKDPRRYLMVWTRGGVDHARDAVVRCDLIREADVCCLKPRSFVDDNETLVTRFAVIDPRRFVDAST